MNEQIAYLTTRFSQNLLKATKESAVVVDNVAELDGASKEQIGAAAEAAKARKLEGKWLITLQNTTIQPLLAELKNRAVREKIYRASIARANGGAEDNTAVVSQIVKLRAEKAALLGYPDFAAYALADATAGKPEAVNEMLARLVPPAIANAKKEAADSQKLIEEQAKAANGEPFTLEPWDWAFYAQARDVEQWFHAHGGLQRANGEFLRAKVLSRGRSGNPELLFEQFYGGPPDIKPLLEHRGLN